MAPPIRITAKIRKVIDNSSEIPKAVALLLSQAVLVGVPAVKTERQPDPKTGKKPDVTNSLLAYIHNYGSPAQNIPARPFLEPGIQDAKDEITTQFEAAGKAAFSGDANGVLVSLNRAGLKAQLGVQNKIRRGPFAPLDPSTLAARRRKGRTGTKPLIDTAQMLQHISYVVRPTK